MIDIHLITLAEFCVLVEANNKPTMEEGSFIDRKR
jgi:hypothetical protein